MKKPKVVVVVVAVMVVEASRALQMVVMLWCAEVKSVKDVTQYDGCISMILSSVCPSICVLAK